MKDKKIKEKERVKPFKEKPFYMVFVEDSVLAPKVKHDDYDTAFNEMLRLSKKENKVAYVVQSITKVEQVPNITQLEF